MDSVSCRFAILNVNWEKQSCTLCSTVFTLSHSARSGNYQAVCNITEILKLLLNTNQISIKITIVKLAEHFPFLFVRKIMEET